MAYCKFIAQTLFRIICEHMLGLLTFYELLWIFVYYLIFSAENHQNTIILIQYSSFQPKIANKLPTLENIL
jgi:uncharacterized membrane protein YukC